MAKDCCDKLIASSLFEVDVSLFENHGKERGIFNREETLAKIENDFNNIPVDDTNRTRYLEETEIPSEASIDHDHARQRHPAAPLSNQMHFIGALKAYSNILRNSELIDDIDLKRDCLNDALIKWSKIIVSTLVYIDNTDAEDFPDDPPSQFTSFTPTQFKEFVKLMIPQLVSSLMVESLATPKLEKFILAETESKIQSVSFLSTMLAIENLNKHSIESVRKLLKTLNGNNIAIQTVFIRLLTLYYFEAPTTSLEAIRDCIGDAFNTLRGASSRERSVMKGQFLQHIDQKRADKLNDADAE
jgi:hypothetical protein